MSKLPSDKTLLRRSTSNERKLVKILTDTRTESDRWRSRALQAEKELTEWKSRFDQLLKIRSEEKA